MPVCLHGLSGFVLLSLFFSLHKEFENPSRPTNTTYFLECGHSCNGHNLPALFDNLSHFETLCRCIETHVKFFCITVSINIVKLGVLVVYYYICAEALTQLFFLTFGSSRDNEAGLEYVLC